MEFHIYRIHVIEVHVYKIKVIPRKRKLNVIMHDILHVIFHVQNVILHDLFLLSIYHTDTRINCYTNVFSIMLVIK